jgi:hypothetical protein
MTRTVPRGQAGGAVEVVLASVALAVALVALVVALTRESGSDSSAAVVTTTTVSAQRLCAIAQADLDKQYAALDAQRASLVDLERDLNDELRAELAANSPNVGTTDAKHQAVLRELSDLQQRLLRLETEPLEGCT